MNSSDRDQDYVARSRYTRPKVSLNGQRNAGVRCLSGGPINITYTGVPGTARVNDVQPTGEVTWWKKQPLRGQGENIKLPWPGRGLREPSQLATGGALNALYGGTGIPVAFPVRPRLELPVLTTHSTFTTG